MEIKLIFFYKKQGKKSSNIIGYNTEQMQPDIDFTTGGLRFYDADPPKTENLSDFVS